MLNGRSIHLKATSETRSDGGLTPNSLDKPATPQDQTELPLAGRRRDPRRRASAPRERELRSEGGLRLTGLLRTSAPPPPGARPGSAVAAQLGGTGSRAAEARPLAQGPRARGRDAERCSRPGADTRCCAGATCPAPGPAANGGRAGGTLGRHGADRRRTARFPRQRARRLRSSPLQRLRGSAPPPGACAARRSPPSLRSSPLQRLGGSAPPPAPAQLAAPPAARPRPRAEAEVRGRLWRGPRAAGRVSGGAGASLGRAGPAESAPCGRVSARRPRPGWRRSRLRAVAGVRGPGRSPPLPASPWPCARRPRRARSGRVRGPFLPSARPPDARLRRPGAVGDSGRAAVGLAGRGRRAARRRGAGRPRWAPRLRPPRPRERQRGRRAARARPRPPCPRRLFPRPPPVPRGLGSGGLSSASAPSRPGRSLSRSCGSASLTSCVPEKRRQHWPRPVAPRPGRGGPSVPLSS